MTDMLDNPATMTPLQRRHEIAAILARGVLRLARYRETPATFPSVPTAENSGEIRLNSLDERAKTSPHVRA